MRTQLFVFAFVSVFLLASPSASGLRITQKTISITSNAIPTNIIFRRDNALPADALVASVQLLGTSVPQITPEEVITNSNGALTIQANDLSSSGNPTSGSSALLVATNLITFCALVAGALLRPRMSTAISFVVVFAAWQVVHVSALRAFQTGWSLEVTVSVPNSYTLDSLTLNIARGSISGGGLSTKALTVQMCSNTGNAIQTFDAEIINTATICASGDVNMFGLGLGATSVFSATSSAGDVNLVLKNNVTGSYSVTATTGTASVAVGACTSSQATAASKAGSCGSSSSSLTVLANKNARVSIASARCSLVPIPVDPAATDVVPSSPAMPTSTPGASYLSWPDSINDVVVQLSSNQQTRNVSGDVLNATITGSGTSLYLIYNPTIPSLRAGTTYRASFELFRATGNNANVTAMGAFVTTVSPGSFSTSTWNTTSYFPITQQLPSQQGNWYSYSVDMSLYNYGSGYITPSNVRRTRFAIRLQLQSSASANRWSFLLRNMRFGLVTTPYPSNPTLLTSPSELVTLPRPDAALDPNPRTNCPHMQSGLLNWHDASTWGGAVPSPNDATITLPADSKVLISSCSLVQGAIYNKIVVPSGSELIFNDADIDMNVKAILVQGKLSIGSPSCRLFSRITITFHGARSDADDLGTGFGTKGIAVPNGGVIEVHGKQFHQTWTRLSATAAPGDDMIYLQDAVNWEVGQEVVITTTGLYDEWDNQNEQLTIKAVSADGLRVQFTTPIRFWHYGGQEYQAEVGLLSRRIVFQGSASSDSDQFGGHVLVMGDGRFSGLQLYRMGQQNMLARYPLHFHLAGSRPDAYVKDCSFLRSYYRCVSIHQTNDTKVLRNVAFDVSGFCYYLEEGVEENNEISYNLAAYVHPIYAMMRNRLGGQSGDSDYENATQPLPADRAAAGFYITNAWNTIVGNAASGGWAGISFPNLPTPLGFSRAWPVVPQSRPTKVFEGNTAHSSGYAWDFGGCIYLGGRLFYDNSATGAGRLRYDSGRNSRAPRIGNRDVWMRFNNTKVFLCNMGLNHWGDRPEVVGFEGHDIARMGQLFGDAWLHRAIINAGSDNPVPFPANTQGFQYYDTWSKAILSDITFRNFRDDPSTSDPHSDNTGLIGMTHSDAFKPQNLAAAINVRWENSDLSQRVGIRNENTGSSRYYAIVDFDGSVSGSTPGQAYILGSATSTWWNYDAACVKNNNWNTYVCPKGNKEVGVLSPFIDNYLDDGQPANSYIGNTTLWGNGVPDGSMSPLTRLPSVTGPTNTGWFVSFTEGAPVVLNITVNQVPQPGFIYFATRYPPGTTFSVYGYNPYFRQRNGFYSAASSLADLWASNGTKYYFDDSHLFLKINNPFNTRSNFTRAGAYVWTPDSGYHWELTITSNCTPKTADGSGREKFCATELVGNNKPGPSSWWN